MAPCNASSCRSKDNAKVIVALVGADSRTDDEGDKFTATTPATAPATTTRMNPNHHRKDRPCIHLNERTDPCTQEKRLYAILEKNGTQSGCFRLCEIQMLSPPNSNSNRNHKYDEESMYSSFLIQSESCTHVTANGKLYLLTDVDPLFFVLAQHEVVQTTTTTTTTTTTQKNSDPWQPLDQILGGVDPVLKTCLDVSQIPHLFATLKLGPKEEWFYKFSTQRALSWLTRKQQVLQAGLLLLLVQQQSAKPNKRNSTSRSTQCGAFAAGFCVSQDLVPSQQQQQQQQNQQDSIINTSHQTDWEEQQRQQAKIESLEILCSYLNDSWKNAFLGHVQETAHDIVVIQSSSQRLRATSRCSHAANGLLSSQKRAAPKEEHDDDDDHNNTRNKKRAKPESAVSAGVKKLAKVNVQGMKKLSAFFGVVSKEENANKKKNNN